jgi:hypothetical protein
MDRGLTHTGSTGLAVAPQQPLQQGPLLLGRPGTMRGVRYTSLSLHVACHHSSTVVS